jgi:hypothetical protein
MTAQYTMQLEFPGKRTLTCKLLIFYLENFISLRLHA